MHPRRCDGARPNRTHCSLAASIVAAGQAGLFNLYVLQRRREGLREVVLPGDILEKTDTGENVRVRRPRGRPAAVRSRRGLLDRPHLRQPHASSRTRHPRRRARGCSARTCRDTRFRAGGARPCGAGDSPPARSASPAATVTGAGRGSARTHRSLQTRASGRVQPRPRKLRDEGVRGAAAAFMTPAPPATLANCVDCDRVRWPVKFVSANVPRARSCRFV